MSPLHIFLHSVLLTMTVMLPRVAAACAPAPPRHPATCAIVVLLALFAAGCGSYKPVEPLPAPDSDSPSAENGDTSEIPAPAAAAPAPMPERPAPGTMIALPPEPLKLESPWAWADIWVSFKDTQFCSVQPFGLKDETNTPAGRQYAVDNPDNHLVFAFDNKAFDAGQCLGLRATLPGSKCAGLWWACEEDVKPDAYPFSRDRFMAFKGTQPGVFEVELSGPQKNVNWTGRIRLLRVDTYGDPGAKVTIEKLQGNLARKSAWNAVQPLKPVLKVDGAIASMGLLNRAAVTGELADLQTIATAWYNSPSYATDLGRDELKKLGTQQGLKMLEAGDVKRALSAFSAAARGYGRPVEYLYELRDSLPESQRKPLWPEGAYLVLEDFSNPSGKGFEQWAESQGRDLVKGEIVSGVSRSGGRSAYLEIGEARQDGASWYAVATHIGLTGKPFAVRVWIKEELPSDMRLLIGYWFPVAKKGTCTTDDAVKVQDDGWKLFDIRRDFFKERSEFAKRQGYDIAGGQINKIGLSFTKGPAVKCWLDSIEIYIP